MWKAPSANWSQTAFVSAAVRPNRIPAAEPRSAARRAGGAWRASRTSGVQTAAKTPPAISHARIGASSRPPDGLVTRRKAISAPVTRTAAPMSIRRTRWPVILAPSGSAKTTAETSSGWTTASRPMVSAIAWQTKPSPSIAIAGQPDRASHHPQEQAGVRAALGLVHAGTLLEHGPEREQERGDQGEDDIHGPRTLRARPARGPVGGVIAARAR